MNRDELDAFFAKADDVLTDWRPGTDAMVAVAPRSDDERLPVLADSYYEQTGEYLTAEAFTALGREFSESMRRMAEQMQQVGRAFAAIRALIVQQALEEGQRLRPRLLPGFSDATLCQAAGKATDPATRALWLRQNRNTGPAPTRGLDGHYRRQRQ